jgi:hypothetical protein
MQPLDAATRAEFPEFQPSRVIPSVLLCGVVPFAALRTLQRDDQPVGLCLFRHDITSLCCLRTSDPHLTRPVSRPDPTSGS